MIYDPICNPLTYSEVYKYHEMIMRGEYNSNSPLTIKMEEFLISWLAYSPSNGIKEALQHDMELFVHLFEQDFSYKGLLFRGIYTGREMPVGRLASWTPDYDIALSFACGGGGDYIEHVNPLDAIKEHNGEILIASMRGQGFDLSGLLEEVADLSDDFFITDKIKSYLYTENEVIAFAYNVTYERINEYGKSIVYYDEEYEQ